MAKRPDEREWPALHKALDALMTNMRETGLPDGEARVTFVTGDVLVLNVTIKPRRRPRRPPRA